MQRWQIINKIIAENKFESYLEIGVQKGLNLQRVVAKYKFGVDPETKMRDVYKMTSDNYFATHSDNYDLIFIDGLHEAEQVERDILNAWQRCKVIVLHDCLPESELMQRVPRVAREWTGDVWRAFVGFREKYPNIKTEIHLTDYGIGVIWVDNTEITAGFITDMNINTFLTNTYSDGITYINTIQNG
jgi:hypothetical protein